jgi:hypothetical protein
MQPAIRDYYHLEELWGEKPVKMKIASTAPRLVKAAPRRDGHDGGEDSEPGRARHGASHRFGQASGRGPRCRAGKAHGDRGPYGEKGSRVPRGAAARKVIRTTGGKGTAARTTRPAAKKAAPGAEPAAPSGPPIVKLMLVAVGHRPPAWAQAAFDDYAKRFPPELKFELKAVKAEPRDSAPPSS